MQSQPGGQRDPCVICQDESLSGVTEAHNLSLDLCESQKLLEVCQAELGQAAQLLHDRILEAVQLFKGDAPQFDDITLMIVRRAPLPPESPR